MTLLTLDRRRIGIVLAVVAAVALVGLAARGGGARRLTLNVSSSATGTAEAMIVILLGLLATVVLVLTVWSMLPERGAGEIEPRRRKRSILGTMLGLVFIAAALSIALRVGDGDEEPEASRFAERPSVPATPTARDDPTSPNWALGAAGVVLLLAVAGVIARVRRSEGLDVSDEPGPAIASHAERIDAIAVAEQCTDPRRAVLLAFAAAEALLSADPSTRRPPSTSAREWAQRVRSAPLTAIVGRYEIARFSHHDVSADDRRVALDALARLR